MKSKRPFFFFALAPIFILLLTAVVMWLWNNIVHVVMNVGTLTYWQALGLFVLCRILFGGFHFRPPFNKNRWEKYNDKWASMSDQERQQMRERWQQRCKNKQ